MGDNKEQEQSSTAGKVIKCRAAVAWEAGDKVVIEEIDVAPPQAGEVRIRITNATICYSDLVFLRSVAMMKTMSPRILGHEASGIIESVGEGVTDLNPGDHVLPLFIGECKECAGCKSSKTNCCGVFNVEASRGTMMYDNKTRFTLNGQPIFRGFSGSFSEYTVVETGYVTKINPEAPLDKALLLSCGAATGIGSVWNVAKVEPGSTIAIFGLGTVGLGVAQGAHVAGASRVIGIDINPNKCEQGKIFGITEFVNPMDFEKPIQEVIKDMTNGGVDYAFECVGSPKLMKAAFNCCRVGWGLAVVAGVTPPGALMELEPGELLRGKSLKGSMYGGWRPKSDIPELVEKYMRNEFLLDPLVTHQLPFTQINDAIQLLVQGKSLRTVLYM